MVKWSLNLTYPFTKEVIADKLCVLFTKMVPNNYKFKLLEKIKLFWVYPSMYITELLFKKLTTYWFITVEEYKRIEAVGISILMLKLTIMFWRGIRKSWKLSTNVAPPLNCCSHVSLLCTHRELTVWFALKI